MQLLKITSVPIKIKMQTHMAKLQAQQEKPSAMIKTTPGRLFVNTQPIKVNIDLYEARKSLGIMKNSDILDEAAQSGIEGAAAAAAEYSELGNRLAQAYKGVSVSDATYSQLVKEPTTQMVFLPSVGAQLSWEGGTVQTDYEPAQVETDWNTGGTELEYVPGEVNIEIEQYPDLKIEYLGKPNYVPPSAEPKYTDE